MCGLYESTYRFILEHHMMPEGGRVVAAVSGGADSMCLLHLLRRMGPSLGIELCCVHVHHGLRGPEADRDASFVGRICGDWGIPCRILDRDVGGYAREYGLSLEEAGRMLRYQALSEAADDWGASSIAVAHHGEDNAETILHHLIRGSGLKGLSGIRPVRGRVVRPLLSARKQDILRYLERHGIPHCEDSTNQDDAFTRNQIRRTVLPLLERVNPRAVDNILQASALVAEADAYMEREARHVLQRWGMADGPGGPWPCQADEVGFPAGDFLSLDPAVRHYVVKGLLEGLAGAAKDITSRHVLAVEELAGRHAGKELDLPYGLRAEKGYGTVRIIRGGVIHKADQGAEKEAFPISRMRIFGYEKGMEFPKKKYTKWFDYDKIKGTPIWRFRQEGDFISLKGGGHKSVKRYMIDEKIAREERDRIPLLADGSHILWIAGRRISEYYKVTGQTAEVLEVVLENGGEDGR